MASRKKISETVQADLLAACRRRCCLCVFLREDEAEKPGQIAHIDRDPSNNDAKNLAWLCLDHHNQYDSVPSQSKGLLKEELRRYKAALEARFLPDRLLAPSERLKLRVRPTWLNLEFGLQASVESRVLYPVKLSAVDIAIKKKGTQSFHRLMLPDGPIIIEGLEDLHFSMPVSGIAPKHIQSIEFVDADNFKYCASPAEIQLFRGMQSQVDRVSRLATQASKTDAIVIKDGDFSAECTADVSGPAPSLLVKVESHCNYPITVIRAELAWSLDPSKLPPSKGCGPRAQQTGSRMGVPIIATIVPPKGIATIRISDFILAFARDGELHRDELQEQSVRLILAEGWEIKVTQDGLPESLNNIFITALRKFSGLS